MPKTLKLLPILFALTLTCCATTGGGAISPEAIAKMCGAWPDVSWSSRDTRETIVDAKAANAAKDAFCKDAK